MAEEVKPAERVSGTVADTQLRESLRGTLLGKLLNPEFEKDKPIFDPKQDLEKKQQEKEPEKPAEPPKPDPTKTTIIRTPGLAEPPEETPKPDEPKVDEPKPKRKSKPAPPRPEPVDVQAVATAAATAAVAAQSEIERSRAAKTEVDELPDDVKKHLPIYDELHRENPNKYSKDLPKRMAKFVKDELAYADKWEKENPGQAFDSESDDHKDWYNTNQPKIDPEDYEEARIAAKARKIIAAEVEPKRQELKTEVEKTQLEPKLVEKAQSLGGDILKSIVPKFEGELTVEAANKVKEEDPIAYEVAGQVNGLMSSVVYHGGLLWNGMQEYNPNEQSHVVARQVLNEFESELGKLNPADLERDGKPWVPIGKYAHMSQAEQAKHYTTGFDDMVNYIRVFAGPATAKKLYEKRMSESKSLVERLAPKYGFKKSEEGDSSQKPPTRAEQPERPNRINPMIHSSPTVPAGTAAPAKDPRSNGKSGDYMDDFFRRMIGG